MTVVNSPSVAPRERALGRRVVAAIIDIMVLGAAGAVLALATGGGESTDTGDGRYYQLNLEGVWFFVWLVGALGYYTVLEAAAGQTLGKKVMDLKVVSSDGSPASFGQILGRNLLRLVDALPAFYLVGFVTAAIDDEGQRLGDKAAGTRVARNADL